MADLTVQTIGQAAGLTPTFTSAAAAGDTFLNNERTVLLAKNFDTQNAKVITVTKEVAQVQQPGFGEIPISDIVATVPVATATDPGTKAVIAPSGSHGGRATCTYDSSSGLTLAVVRSPRGL